jgi:uncharacterized membrane protein YkvA (DUF1232 family)
MAIEISFELSDEDVEHFASMARAAQKAFQDSDIDENEIIDSTSAMLSRAGEQENLPEFIASRLTTLQVLVNMIQDKDWELPDEDRKRVLSAMAYFAHPEDLIPDRIPGIGFLDDAIMIELIERELEPEISTYRDFCQYRIAETQRRINLDRDPEVTIKDWLADKRASLHNRMRQRRSHSLTSGRVRIYLW